MSRLVLLVTSPRLPAGLLTAQAWDLVRTYRVYAGGESDQIAALRSAGCDVVVLTGDPVDPLLAALTEHDTVVWLAGPAGDEALARALGLRLAREPGRAELELCYGSWDPPGARLLDVVSVLDRLVSPGGDPWKRSQTHQTLARYLIEEAYEAHDAMAADDLPALREELGDVLFQVALHARMAQEADPPWSIDDVAGGLVEKLVRRNPHVFAGLEVTDLDEITANWERIKAGEKQRSSVLDGIPWAQPALALAAKLVHRAHLPVVPIPGESPVDDAQLGHLLFAVVTVAVARGLDPEGALRAVAVDVASGVQGRAPS